MTIIELTATAAAAGLVGSVHCAVMCGPLALGATSGARPGASSAAYLAARLFAYATVGAVLGELGHHALCILPVGKVQLIAVILLAGFAAARGLRSLWPERPAPPLRFGKRARPGARVVARVLASAGTAPVTLGLVTAILPCGVLLPAWALAASTGQPLAGALVMTVFALASSPGLALPILLRRLGATRLAPSWRPPRWVHGLAWCTLALWLALRPLLGALHHHH